jgi:plastocyanin
MRLKLFPAVLAVTALGLAGCGGDDGGGGDASTDIEVMGEDSLSFDPDEFTVPAGQEVTVTLTSGGVEHDFVVEDLGGEDVDVVHADANQTETGTFTADEAGTYTVFCSVPGHREAGMEATLEVVDEG